MYCPRAGNVWSDNAAHASMSLQCSCHDGLQKLEMVRCPAAYKYQATLPIPTQENAARSPAPKSSCDHWKRLKCNKGCQFVKRVNQSVDETVQNRLMSSSACMHQEAHDAHKHHKKQCQWPPHCKALSRCCGGRDGLRDPWTAYRQ